MLYIVIYIFLSITVLAVMTAYATETYMNGAKIGSIKPNYLALLILGYGIFLISPLVAISVVFKMMKRKVIK